MNKDTPPSSFEEINFNPHHHDEFGERAVFNFANGYGASIICGQYSYGGSEGLYEVAVMHNEEICYDSGLTEDVIGHLDKEDVVSLLNKISKLTPKG